jgi:hypothetical protein
MRDAAALLSNGSLAKAAALLLSLSALAFVNGCGASRPPDSQARKVVEVNFQHLTQLGAKITDFRKLNAESGEQEGQKIYIYHFLAAAELPAGIAWHSTSGSVVAFANRGGFVKDTPERQHVGGPVHISSEGHYGREAGNDHISFNRKGLDIVGSPGYGRRWLLYG